MKSLTHGNSRIWPDPVLIISDDRLRHTENDPNGAARSHKRGPCPIVVLLVHVCCTKTDVHIAMSAPPKVQQYNEGLDRPGSGWRCSRHCHPSTEPWQPSIERLEPGLTSCRHVGYNAGVYGRATNM
jgi:hypothetical protein